MNYVKGMFSKKDAGEPVEEENAEIQSEESEQEQEQVEKKVKNFPPCYPLVYHSFSACGKKKYLALMGLNTLPLFSMANFIGLVIALVLTQIYNYIGGIAISACFLIFFPFIGFFAQYWITYGACSHKNSARYVIAFISYVVGIVFSLLMAVGVPSMGACGLVGGLWMINRSGASFAMIYSFIMAAVWSLNVIYQIVIVLCLFKHFNEEGSSIGRAKDQIVSFFVKRSITTTISGAVGGGN